MAEALEQLEVNESAMRANLESLLPDQPQAFGSAGPMIEAALEEWARSTTFLRGTAP
jgi:hypothetical protein